jgi:hypothetical protein
LLEITAGRVAQFCLDDPVAFRDLRVCQMHPLVVYQSLDICSIAPVGA